MPTPSQTIGPFFRFGMDWLGADLVPPGSAGSLVLVGTVFDGGGEPVPDAMVEIWQADAAGRFPPDTDPWTGLGRSLTGGDGAFAFTTVAPGPVDGGQAPHIDVSVFARGLLQRVVTRVYLAGHPANDTDPLLARIESDRRATLLATEDGGGLRFDIHLQGPRETVFLAW
jgi:protocatechuate 3,4-dioxygenase alpha subunit